MGDRGIATDPYLLHGERDAVVPPNANADCPDSSLPLKRGICVLGQLQRGSWKKSRPIRDIWDVKPPKRLETCGDEGEQEDRRELGKEKV